MTTRQYTFTQPKSYRLNPVGADLSPDAAYGAAWPAALQWPRHLDENNPLAVSVLDEMVTRIVGSGIVIRPAPGLRGRDPNRALSETLRDLWEPFEESCDVTGELPWHEYQRLACRAWLRDGEHFAQHVGGRNRGYGFARDEVPYKLEFIESEMIPADLFDEERRIAYGVELSQWRRPSAYYVYRHHPGHTAWPWGSPIVTHDDVLRIPAQFMLSVKFVRRWPQVRGITVFHAAVASVHDAGEVMETERIAARVAGSMSAAIVKSGDHYDPPDASTEEGKAALEQQGKRELYMEPGLIFDDLLPGESVEALDSTRPNNAVVEFRRELVREICAATGSRYSPVARDYSGSYAATRQELVEARPQYDRLRNLFIDRVLRPVYRRFVTLGVLDGQLSLPTSLTLRDVSRAEYFPPVDDWIDPLKETQADALAVARGFATREQIVRRRNRDPDFVPEPAPTVSAVQTGADDDDEATA